MIRKFIIFALLFTAGRLTAVAQQTDLEFYQELRKFELGADSVAVDGLVLQRDRVKLTFTSGRLYFAAPVAGEVRGAVFIGRGQFQADVPNSSFERQHVQRVLNAQAVESDFETAVLRFTDDTFEKIRAGASSQATVVEEARKLAAGFDAVLLAEVGLNATARMVVAIANRENPGVFLAQFDGGRRNRFAYVFDPQGRVPATAFGVNAGEKGIIFGTRANRYNDVWMAFYALDDYQKGTAPYSDAFDLVEPIHHETLLDVRNPGRRVGMEVRLDLRSRVDGVRAIPFEMTRSKTSKRLKSSSSNTGDLVTIQEDGEAGVTVLMQAPRMAQDLITINLSFEVDDMMIEHPLYRGLYYPDDTISWMPHHGYLQRSTYRTKFLHRKDHKVFTIGTKIGEEPIDGNPNEMITEWDMTDPAAFATFAVGDFEVHQDKAAGIGLPIEFYSHRDISLKEDFITGEMGNAVNYFTTMFGAFPFKKLNGAFHPRGFGQGFPSLLMLAPADVEISYMYSFIAHETAHQWWGNVVSWRSYRDQWLSEGFADYSGMLYTKLRAGPQIQRILIERARRELLNPPVTLTGIGSGKLSDVGPIVLGYRLNSNATQGTAQTLIYSKGGLVLRMLHFLFTDPATGEGQAFFDMMRDFVDKHRGAPATNDSFRDVANQHFPRTPIAMKYGLKDLNWFFNEWVYQTALPSYRMEYRLEDAGDGAFLLNYTLHQENAPQDWLTIMPLRLQFGPNQSSTTSVHVQGGQTTGRLRLPSRPSAVELDPELWTLSERTTTRELK